MRAVIVTDDAQMLERVEKRDSMSDEFATPWIAEDDHIAPNGMRASNSVLPSPA